VRKLTEATAPNWTSWQIKLTLILISRVICFEFELTSREELSVFAGCLGDWPITHRLLGN
jgi:hypothetical protein